MKKITWGFLILFMVCLLFIAYWFGASIPIGKQLDIYSSLKGVATVIFGIMGAWLAIIYPNALRKIFSKEHSLNQADSNIKKIFFPMRVATVIVIFTLAQEWLYPILHEVNFLIEQKENVRIVSFVILTVFVIALLWSLILTLLPMENVEREIESTKEHFKQIEQKTSRTTKRKKRNH